MFPVIGCDSTNYDHFVLRNDYAYIAYLLEKARASLETSRRWLRPPNPLTNCTVCPPGMLFHDLIRSVQAEKITLQFDGALRHTEMDTMALGQLEP